MPKDTTRYSSNTSYDKLELDVYLEFYPEYLLLVHQIQVIQSKQQMFAFVSFIFNCLLKEILPFQY